MYLYRYNDYTKKYYKYDMDFYDIMSPMFDETIHNETELGIIWESNNRNMCRFCGTVFNSRNQLFHHLGYMNIDIRKKGTTLMDIVNEYDEQKGDYGMMPIYTQYVQNKSDNKNDLNSSRILMKKRGKVKKITSLISKINICG